MSKDLEPDLERLPEIRQEAVEEYYKEAETLIEYVNKDLKNRRDIGELLGNNSLEVMYENHENHAAFMANVFKLNDYKLLKTTVSWVYRTYHNHGFSYDYFPVELRSWKEAVDNFLSPESGGEIKRIYSFLIEHHQDFVELAEEGRGPYGLDIPEQWEKIADTFLDVLLAGDHEKALDVAKESVSSSKEVGDFFESVVKPAMYQVGEKWEDGEISVAEEHLASSIVSRVLSAIYTQFMTFERTKGKAVITATANEFHEIGSRIIADSLELDGWDVDHLGVDTPVQDLVDLLVDKKPFMLGLSLAIPFNLDNLVETIESVQAESELKNIKILVGGKAFNDNPEIGDRVGADALSRNSQEAVKTAAEWWRKKN